jgi:hypothetical protein
MKANSEVERDFNRGLMKRRVVDNLFTGGENL